MHPSSFALAALAALASTASAQFIPGVTATSTLGTFGTYNLLNLTNGVGLTGTTLSALHSSNWQDMWMGAASVTTGTLEFDLGSVQPLATIAVWNYNSSISLLRGVQRMNVSTSTDGINFAPLSQETVPQGTTQPLAPHLIQVGGIPAQYVRFDILSNYGTSYTGLSEVQFVAGTGSGIGSNAMLGQGCIRQASSFYEYFPTAASFDLGNSSIGMIPNGPGYIVLSGASAFVPPSPAATTLSLANNGQVAVSLSAPFPYAGGSTSSLSVCSNGYVAVAAGNSTSGTPAPATMLNAPQTAWWAWHDYDPAAAGGGQVKFEQVGSIAYITWNGVYDSGGSSPSTFQFQFDTASGLVNLVFGTMSGLGTGYLVGYSPGGASTDHGSMDLSAALPGSFLIGGNDVLPLTLVATTRPVIGTNWSLNVTNVPASATIGFDILGFADPNIPDLGVLGAPGCPQRASLDLVTLWLVSGPSHAYSLPVPNNPLLSDLHVYAQALVLQPGANTLFGGAITSNGVDGKLGTL